MALVTLIVVANELEAEALCGMLRANGIPCSYRKTNAAAGISAFGGGGMIAGPTEILVAEDDLARARELVKT